MVYLLIFLALISCSCGYSPMKGSDIAGADEFVMDSYKIREGKYSILELEGKAFDPLPPETLNEYELKGEPGKVEFAGLVQIAQLPADGKLRLYEALTLAKVPTHANLYQSYLVRDNLILPVDFFKLMKEGEMSQNVVLRGGDKVYIAEPSASAIMLFGEVGKEGVVPLPNGFMSLKMALAYGGGITPYGDKSYIQVIRGNLTQPKIYTLHWKHLLRLPNESLLLMPGDIVYVASTPIAEWNRFVTQLLPTLVTVNLISKGDTSVGFILP